MKEFLFLYRRIQIILIPFDAIEYNQNLNGRKMNWNVKRNDELFNISVNEARLS